MRTIALAAFVVAPLLFAQGGANCKPVSGAISTNFTSDTSTMGTASGDLNGAVGVDVLSVTPAADGSLVFHVQHRWVTESGDSILLSEADASAYPVAALPGLYAVSYKSGVQVKGGTGKFEGASGTLASFGAVSFPGGQISRGQVTLRYSGNLCIGPVSGH